MIDKRLERALEWCRENNIESSRLKKFNREQKKKRSEKKKGKLSSKKAEK